MLGDSAYALRPWLLTPFPGVAEGAKLHYNNLHIKTRNCIERAFGVAKARFSALKTGIRLKDPVHASKLIMSCMILHNLCIKYGDTGEDRSDLVCEGKRAERGTRSRSSARGTDRGDYAFRRHAASAEIQGGVSTCANRGNLSTASVRNTSESATP